MAALTGAKGMITLPTTVVLADQALLITRWSASFERDIFDISSFAPAPVNGREKLGGMMVLVGTCEGPVDGAATPIIDKMQEEDYAGVTGFKFTLDTTPVTTDAEYKFSAIIESLELDVPKNGITRYSLAFRSTKAVGAITAIQPT